MSGSGPPLSLLVRELPHVAQLWSGRWRKPSSIDGLAEEAEDVPPIIVVPGLMSRDYSTSLLRKTLKASGFPTYSSKMGFMRGVTKGRLERAEKRLHQISERHGSSVILVGWSLGGLYTRVLAQRHPDLVKMVVTLGTPFSGNRRANNAWRVYEFLNDHSVDAPPVEDDASVKPPMRTVAIWSAQDGVIAPECARGLPHERDVEVEINSRHFTFGAGRPMVEQVTRIIAAELAKA